MMDYNSIYSQLFNFIPRYRFEKIVKKSGGDRYCKHFTAWKQFLTLLFAQISGKATTMREIAKEYKMDRSFAARTLQLANLSPDIVKLIWETVSRKH